jgi:hypothetical protein
MEYLQFPADLLNLNEDADAMSQDLSDDVPLEVLFFAC